MKKIKTLKSFIEVCELISSIDREELKGIKTEAEYDQIGIIRGSIQNELGELKRIIKNI